MAIKNILPDLLQKPFSPQRRNSMQCPSCHRRIGSGDKKCSHCGARLDVQYCPNGHVMEPGETVCKYCPPVVNTRSAELDATFVISDLQQTPPEAKETPVDSPSPSAGYADKTRMIEDGPRGERHDDLDRLIGWIVVVDGRDAWRDFRICKRKTILGRSKHCDIVLDDDYVSAKHASLRLIDGDFVITDLDSSNGTFVNDREAAQASLHDGDLIKLGKTTLKLKLL